MRTLPEDGIIEIWTDLCDKCRYHCENYVHLCSGFLQNHIVTDQEMTGMIAQLNKETLINVLLVYLY